MTSDARANGSARAAVPTATVLFLLALGLRLAHLATVRGSPFSSLLMLDPALYDDWGWAIARGEPWGGVYFQDPLYAYFLGLVYKAFGHEYLAATALQSLLGATVAPLVFLAARPWLGTRTAIVSGALAALYLPALHYDGIILKTSLAHFLVAAWLALLSWAARRAEQAPARLPWAAAGSVLGLACLTRGNLLLLVPLVAAWVVLDVAHGGPAPARWTERLREARGLGAAGALVLGCSIALLPATLHNRIVGGEWVLTTANAGQNFYIGNNPLNASGEYQWLPFVDPNPKFEQRDFAREAARRDPHATGARAVSRLWFGEALGWVRSDPAGWLRLLWRKLRAYWGAYEIPDNLDYYLYREYAPVLRWPGLSFGLVAPFGLLGTALALRARGWPRLLALFVSGYSLSVVAFFVLARFRMSMMPALYVLAAQAALAVGQALGRARRDPAARRSAARLAAGLIAAAAFVNLPVRGRVDSPLVAAARELGLPVRVETSATGRFNLGVAYAARAKDAEDPAPWLARAEGELRRAWAEEQRYASIPVELGKVLARMGRNTEAVELYRAAAAIEPDDYRTHHALGLLYRRLGDPAAAEASFRTALGLEPRHAPSAVQLGETLLELGRREEAAEAFRRALALSPQDERAARGLREAE